MVFNYTIILYFLFIYLHSYTTTIFGVSEGNGSTTSTPIIQCIEAERKALEIFRENLVDFSGRLSSWESDDCCSWQGITCDDNTGHVTSINLRNPQRSRYRYTFDDSISDTKASLGGKLSISLLELKYLSHLDLSLNDFEGNPIPKFLGELKRLTYLNLACSNFSGIVPPQLGNLTNLQSLDLYSDFSFNSLSTKSLYWLTNLSSLKYLNLGGVTLSSDWLPSLSKLHSLLDLNLYDCSLNTTFRDNLPSVNFTSLVRLNMSSNGIRHGSHLSWLSDLTSLEVLDLSWNYDLVGPIPTLYADLTYLDLSRTDLSFDLHEILLGFQKMSNLQYLDLSYSNFSGSIPTYVGNFSSLRMLGLSENNLTGSIPSSIGNLISLRKLDLSGNSLLGLIPSSIGNLLSLEILDLSENMMNGNIPESLGRLSQLVELHLNSNNWTGILTEAHLISLRSLKSYKLTTDAPMSLAFNVTYDWVPPFNLEVLDIENCLVGPAFSVWLQKQRSLTSVVLQNTGISDIIPDNWFSSIASDLTYLDLSSNKIRGKLPRGLVFPNLSFVNLSCNQFEGEFPNWSSTATEELYLQENIFSKSLPQDIGDLMPKLFEMDLSWNLFDSIIPSSLCKMKNMVVLLLGNNKFSGDIPDCWDKAEHLWGLDLSNNRLSGTMPTSFGNSSIRVLSLGNNNLHGKIMNASAYYYMMILDLGENNFSGSLPEQMNEGFSNLCMVVLRDNFFSGKIPPGFCKFEYLHYFDLSWNNFSGTIPKCINNLTALVDAESDIFHDIQHDFKVNYVGVLNIRTKGNEYEYGKTASLVNGIDLSGNFLTGEIPVQMTKLKATSILNLSRNHLSGKIPQDIGDMIALETLDLSCNHLSGPIPPSLSSPTFLSHLNLSYNNLEGRIPSGNELQTLTDPSIYEGNPLLCGTPLPTKCPGDPETTVGVHEEKQDKNENEDVWFYLVIALGFIVGFWSVCGTLVLNNSWRDAFFKFFGRIKPLQSLMD
ncbi:unnamed protein product [Amaranthus hypochondriacus]